MPTDQEINERFAELPADVQRAIQSADMTTSLQETGKLHGLHVDQLGALEDESLLVMLGFANPADFAKRVEQALAVDGAAAEAIAEEISAKLFVPIRNSMRAYMEERLKRSQQPTNNGHQTTIAPNTDVNAPPAVQPSLNTAPGIPVAAQPITNSAPQEGKIIMPANVQPTIHPIDQMLAKPTITTPTVIDYGTPGVLQTPATPASKQYATDPYREPIE